MLRLATARANEARSPEPLPNCEKLDRIEFMVASVYNLMTNFWSWQPEGAVPPSGLRAEADSFLPRPAYQELQFASNETYMDLHPKNGGSVTFCDQLPEDGTEGTYHNRNLEESPNETYCASYDDGCMDMTTNNLDPKSEANRTYGDPNSEGCGDESPYDVNFLGGFSVDFIDGGTSDTLYNEHRLDCASEAGPSQEFVVGAGEPGHAHDPVVSDGEADPNLMYEARLACKAVLEQNTREVYPLLEPLWRAMGLCPDSEVDLYFAYRESLSYLLAEDLPSDEQCVALVRHAFQDAREALGGT